MTGADISPAAIDLAGSLAIELGFPEARVVQSNLYDLPEALEGTFDVVSTSRGALNWLPDIQAWATIVAHIVAPGGIFLVPRSGPSSAPAAGAAGVLASRAVGEAGAAGILASRAGPRSGRPPPAFRGPV